MVGKAREIANLPNDVQVELFCSFARFPTITFLVLKNNL
jgi:hypothetical protein